MASDKDIKQVAKEFIKALRESLTSEEIEEVIQKNDTEEYSGCCATHDYVDANMVMEEALVKVGLPVFTEHVPLTHEWDASLEVVNKAWDMAKSVRFDERKIDE